MKSYNPLERKIAKALDAFPAVRSRLRKTYQYINYYRYKEKNFTLKLNSSVSIESIDNASANFFGYYDKSPWNSEMSKYIYQEISGESLRIMVKNIENGITTEVGKTATWNFQQGSMAQWLYPDDKIIYNDIVDDMLVSKLYHLESKKTDVIPFPVQTVHPRGRNYLSLNYSRLDKLRPEYGYNKQVTNFSANMEYANDGIWKVDLNNQEEQLIINLEYLVNNQVDERMSGAKHKINHIIYSPDGNHFLFMHRWIGNNGKFSRLYVATASGKMLKILLDDRMVSHYHWIDNDQIIVWGRKEEIGDKYFIININSGEITSLENEEIHQFGDGHPSVSPNKEWIVTDTYPDKKRQRHLILYHLPTGRIKMVGSFFAPWRFDEEVRCDLHPRWSPSGHLISIDSVHEGIRRNYILNVKNLTD